MANRYWFRPKSYGYGATPATWEGWTVTFAGVAVVVVSTWYLLARHAKAAPGDWTVWTIVVTVTVAVLVAVSYCKTDGPWRWRWGSRAGPR
jgi:hypothetical protein